MSTAQGERRLMLASTRHSLKKIPVTELFEIPGRPHVVYQLKDYSAGEDYEAAAALARQDSPFLFKAFETGQIGPKRLSKISGDAPRVATIHEYLEWTVTSQSAEADDELDFSGFRVLVILQRFVPGWPPFGTFSEEGKKSCDFLGAEFNPLPSLQSHSKPICAATVRAGPGYLEVPFVATSESKRGRGYCRCLVEALEDVSRGLSLPLIMLCSTNDPVVKLTWSRLGFQFTSESDMEHWDIEESDLVHLQNTTQMHKVIGPAPQHKALIIKQGNFKQRIYVRLDKDGHPLKGGNGVPNPEPPAPLPPEDAAALAAAAGGGLTKGGEGISKGKVSHTSKSGGTPASKLSNGKTATGKNGSISRNSSSMKAPNNQSHSHSNPQCYSQSISESQSHSQSEAQSVATSISHSGSRSSSQVVRC
uniref:Increased DNA methylation 1 C-terminal domain-containing protein n=1 Tax=Polytomella parva TaxID=51329 RepID=A0A7S0V2M2_9CHLO|mmetsp:Transcript_28988/g.53272  ORF Transcript_28988/g.53272 Transcript_28988/m.53272 type:complete len:420 (+) Transcript_28988:93-1352(+)|eukprot:CAMPEP_0175051560 /NCGR_PEP_ID=MMETSP0052_2-20121109/7875_1 /TAXON_ID=51329 ORGANISM="Polytomella parva, Strain SAG 63-3" /NCGR_SAMPLE_ID=MMETSP0052_2 /ASSEMBLY_ACC=CAM_ASM_000194 /LENGTH=419 /DNA_ID=CAMNT_0016315873 /DNA_START=27 /DNA_END=1286 /DNA_ORIENTATION=-